MSKSVVKLSLVLIAGIALGLSVAYVVGFHKSADHMLETADRDQAPISPLPLTGADTRDDNDTETISFAENRAVAEAAAEHTAAIAGSTAPEAAGEMESGELVATLRSQIAVEAAARRRIEVKLGSLEEIIEALQQQLAERLQEDAQARSGNNRPLDQDAFIAAGFTPVDAAYLAQRVGQQDMDVLYLRDQAIREGWIDTPRYEEAVQELRDDRLALREELGTDGYDRFLYASGQPNRVFVDSVIDSSPGQTIGLQPGDVIISYNGDRVYSPRDLRSATTSSNTDESVALQVDRGGQIIEYYLPGGPIGIRIGVDSVQPGENLPVN